MRAKIRGSVVVFPVRTYIVRTIYRLLGSVPPNSSVCAAAALLPHCQLATAEAPVGMFVASRWKMVLRFIASALVFESALSFRPVFQHQHVVPAECGRLFSSPLKSTSSSGAHQVSSGLSGPGRLRAEGSRQRQTRRRTPPEQQPSLVVMLAGAERGDSGPTAAASDAGGVKRDGEAVGVPHAAGNTPSAPSAEQQVSCLKLGPPDYDISIKLEHVHTQR